MAKVTLQIGGSVVAPVASPGRSSDAWRLDAFAEAAFDRPRRRGHRFPLNWHSLDRIFARGLRAARAQMPLQGEVT